jgi:8-oxo-dGTP pyrophosphatase MutT (NUDIX family)
MSLPPDDFKETLERDYGRFTVHMEKLPDKPYPIVWIRPGDAVAVIPYNDEGFWLGEQYRRPTDTVIRSTCAGMIDKGESPVEAAHRELEEEFGMMVEELYYIAGFYTSEGITDEFTYMFAAENPTFKEDANIDIDEGIEVNFFPWEELDTQLDYANNAKLVIALAKLDRFYREKKFFERYGLLQGRHKYVAVPNMKEDL